MEGSESEQPIRQVVRRIGPGDKNGTHFINTLMRKYIEIVRQLNEAFVVEGDIEGSMKLGPIAYDQKDGIGAVSDNSNIKYLGFAAFMYPRMFLALAAQRDFSQTSNLKMLESALKQGKPFASPFLAVRINHEGGPAKIGTHEGRTRCKAIQSLYGEIPVLVHFFFDGGDRARHVTLEEIEAFRQSAIPEKQTSPISGPHFSKQVWFQNGWKMIQ